jgi:hypothetical protein
MRRREFISLLGARRRVAARDTRATVGDAGGWFFIPPSARFGWSLA